MLSCLTTFGQQQLSKELAGLIKGVRGDVGVALTIIETGDTVFYQGEVHFPMQSVYKFPIAMFVLDQVDRGQLSLDQKIAVVQGDFIPRTGHSPIRDKFPSGTQLTISELLYYAVSESDGSASDILLRIIGGASEVERYIHNHGVREISIQTTEREQVTNDTVQYRNWSSPRSMAKLLTIFYKDGSLSKNSREVLMKLMTETVTGQKRLKGLLPKGTKVAHKTGTSATFNGLTGATNDVGIITLPNGKHLGIAVFVKDSPESETRREALIAAIVKAAFDFWNAE